MSSKELLNKIGLTIVFMIAYAALYQYPNFYPFQPPVQLHMTWVDRTVPFLPWTFPVYLSDWFLIIGTGFALRDEAFARFARMAFSALFLCGMCFIFFPTVYPRPEYPEVSNWLVALAMDVITVADRPTNCFPSMHVAMTSVAAWGARSFSKKTTVFIWIWAFIIFVSTLTTKQHYLVDIFGGVIAVLLAGAIEYVYVTKREGLKAVVGRLGS